MAYECFYAEWEFNMAALSPKKGFVARKICFWDESVTVSNLCPEILMERNGFVKIFLTQSCGVNIVQRDVALGLTKMKKLMFFQETSSAWLVQKIGEFAEINKNIRIKAYQLI